MLNFLNNLKKSRGILGINERSVKYSFPFNRQKAKRIADSKILTKKVLRRASLPVAETFGIIRNRKELQYFDWQSLPKSFVLKPNRGLGGSGILLVYGKKKGQEVWVKANKETVTIPHLTNTVLGILDGDFSRVNIPDIAIFEERIKIHPTFKPYSYRGIPDIRIIIFNDIPIMAELRLPTQESSGAANLHQGGIGIGVDIATGVTTNALQRDKIIQTAPGTRLSLRGIKIPSWNEMLRLAIESHQAIGLGFSGVDISLDREKGPIILEVNARPGLSIQIANMSPLGERLKRVSGLKVKSIKKGILLAKELFGGDIEEEVEEISGKKVIGMKEPIIIFDRYGDEHQTVAKVDTGAYRTTICQSIAHKLNLEDATRYKKVRSALGQEERKIINLRFKLDGILIETEAFIANREHMKCDIIIGRKDIKKFLVDPAKNVKLKSTENSQKS